MELSVKDTEIIERALFNRLEKFANIHKEHQGYLKDEFNMEWEQTRILHSKFCKLSQDIEDKIQYQKANPEVNQALNEIIVVQN